MKDFSAQSNNIRVIVVNKCGCNGCSHQENQEHHSNDGALIFQQAAQSFLGLRAPLNLLGRFFYCDVFSHRNHLLLEYCALMRGSQKA